MAQSKVPWEKIYDYVLECGATHDPAQFVAAVLDNMDGLIPYDQGLAYCLDENRNVKSQHLVNIKTHWSTMYRKYYAKTYMGEHGMQGQAHETFGMPFVHLIDWNKLPLDEFIANYIEARGVKSSLAFVFFDLHGIPRAIFSLDRTQAKRFTEHELDILHLAAAQLNNLFKNFFIEPSNVPGGKSPLQRDAHLDLLTKREQEIVDLLCYGFSPARVSEALHINKSTTYKHIQHIYTKLQVSSQQELLVRLLK